MYVRDFTFFVFVDHCGKQYIKSENLNQNMSVNTVLSTATFMPGAEFITLLAEVLSAFFYGITRKVYFK